MTWNYRVMKHVEEDFTYYHIHEVYYNEDGSVASCSQYQCSPFGADVEELTEDFKLMAGAFERPVIPYEEI